MDLFIAPEWAPNIHPLLVHFPIALLVIAALAHFVSLFIPEKWWDETKNTVLYTAGAICTGITYYSGTIAADSVFLPSEAQSVLSEHADWAEYLLWFFIIYALLRIAFHWFGLFEKRSFKVITFITVLPGLFMIYETAEYGGKMVFGYGVGTGQLIQPEQPVSEGSSKQVSSVVASSFTENENGSWSWKIHKTSVSDLISNFHWIEGSVQDLQPEARAGQLKLEATQNPNFFVTHENSKNVQMDVYLNIENLTGEVRLAHHVQDTQNYDFVTLNNEGTIRQGRIKEGETTIFEEGSFDPKGTLFVSVVADGTHFRGYVNREMKVHGHGDAPESGSVGIRIKGKGKLLISKIELTPLN
jgi:uncharacterized membrane protein